MESSVVVKVKYGDKLRRFNAAVKENRTLELDIEGLRAKIRSLFNFAADSELELTYEDEDQDIVALVDEEDLHDVLKQDLDPVRITVQINTGSSTAVRSSGTSTSVPGQPGIHSGVADLLKTVPEPFRGHLVKLSAEVASRTASSTPILTELIDSIRHSFLNVHSHPQTSADNVAPNKEASESLNEPGKVVSASGNEREGAQSNFEKAMRNYSNMPCNDKKAEKKPLGLTKEEAKRKLISFKETPMYKLDIGTSSGKPTAVEAEKKPFGRSKEEAMRNSIECPFSGLHMPPSGVYAKPEAFGSQSSVFHRGVQCDGCGVHPITGPRFKSKVKENYDLCHICFEQMGKDSEYTRIDVPALYRHPWSFKSNPHVFHPRHWAQAPPPPPMFGKHMKQCRPKLDSRFILDVNIMDGTIMAPKTPFTKIWRMRNNGNLPWIRGTQLVWIGGDNFSPNNSVEIEIPASGFYPENEVDVAVDFIAPESPGRYISYWKMASASGQKFGQRIWVLVQVDASLSEATTTATVPNSLNLNLPPEGAADNLPEMLDIPIEPLNMVEQLKQLEAAQPLAVMGQSPLEATHGSQLAGQQWLLLSDEQNKQRLFTSRSLPEMPGTPAEEAQLPDLLHEQRNMLQSGELVAAARKQQLDVLSQLGNNPNVPLWGRLVDQELIGPSSSAPLLPDTELGLVQPPLAPVEVPLASDTNSQVEEVLLKELEQMGFKQVDMNKTVLRKNDYDFEKSLDELCNVSEWDLLLEEMRGMGFVDGEANKRVLAKNNGSLKHAVMDLITRENV